MTQAMTIRTRWAPGGHQPAQCPRFLFGAKGASAGAECRGIRQRFPYWCNETKTSRTAGRRSPWSPRRHHHQSLWQAKTTFVRISCTSCPLSNWPLLTPFPLSSNRGEKGLPPPSPPSTRTPLRRRLFFPLYCSSSAQEAIHHHHTRVGYYTTTVARTDRKSVV